MTTEREIDLAEFLRDTRLAGCEHSTTLYPEACSPCTRDAILASPWLTANTEAAVNAAVEAAAVRVEALCEHPPALRGACFACFAAARAVRGDS